MIGYHCPIDLLTRTEPYVFRLAPPCIDSEGYERGQRINGFAQCPKCGVWEPVVEEPDMWDEADGVWVASGWWGGAICEECNLLLVEQPDGTPECYELQ